MIAFKHGSHGECQGACCLKVQHLSVTLDGEEILKDVNLHMHCGQITALIGPNGAGKSTLLKAILGQRSYEGEIDFSTFTGKHEKLRIGYVPQSPTFDKGDPISVLDLYVCCISSRPAFLPVSKKLREQVRT